MMKVIVSGNGANLSPVISLQQDHENFKVTVCIIPSAGYDGTAGISYSPDGINWFPHEDLWGLTGVTKVTGNLFFPIPFVRAESASGTTGNVEFHLFGSVHR